MTNETATANADEATLLMKRDELWRYTVTNAPARTLIDAARAAEAAARKLRKLATESHSDLQRERVRRNADCELRHASDLLALDKGRGVKALQRDGADYYARAAQ